MGPHFFLWVLSLLVVRHRSKLSFYAIYRKTKEPNLRKWQKKPDFGQHFDLLGPNWVPNFFLWVLPLLVFRYCFKLSLHSISRKTNKPNLGKWQKKPSFRTDFGPFGPNLAPQAFINYNFSYMRFCAQMSMW